MDDNENNRRILSEQTSSWGMPARGAEDGPAAETLRRAVSRGEPSDLAILDMVPGEMDGLELANRIKSDSSLSEVKPAEVLDHRLGGCEPASVGVGAAENKTGEGDKPDGAEVRWEPFSCLDVGAAIERLGGDESLYFSLLPDFVEMLQNQFPGIRAAWRNRDLAQAGLLVHSLKGAAGNLSAVGLQKAAVEFEAEIGKGGADGLDDLIAGLESCGTDTLACARQLLISRQPRAVPNAVELRNSKLFPPV
ncbi:MAG: response regulator [Syntrophobacteraceae bacterium]|nr:response regulator [Syntrophobacteraceae bacterium]